MLTSDAAAEIAESIRKDVDRSQLKAKRVRVRSLLRKFGFSKRSDSNTAEITRLLGQYGVLINPPIIRLGMTWQLHPDDWIHLATGSGSTAFADISSDKLPEIVAKRDPWFERIEGMVLRTEKEVEIKFIVPLLTRLGYTEDDRYGGMPVPAAHGSRATTLVIDFAMFNSTNKALRNQPLLTVEAKHESRLKKAKEIQNAHNQAKSYCLWTQCDHFMITDSRTVQVFHVARGGLNGPSPLFSCSRETLKSEFANLYRLISKPVLTNYCLANVASMEEAE